MTAAWLLAACAVSLATGSPLSQRASSACTNTHHEGYNNDIATHTIKSGNYNRTYAVSVPKGYNDNLGKKWPLIIDFHGNGGTPDSQWNNSQYFNYPAGQQYLIVYPQGYEKHWQGPSYAVKGVDDLQFVTDLTTEIKSQYCVDDNRVYASGKSNGGGFVDTLACSDNGDEFSAFGMAAAALYTDTNRTSCTKKRAILESHGDEDGTIAYGGGQGSGGQTPNITQWVSWWGSRDCGPGATAKYSGNLGGYNTTTYSCSAYKDVVKHYQVFKLGHCWPDSKSDNTDASLTLYNQTERKCLDRVLDYTPVVLDFFSKWNATNAPSN